MKIKPGVAVQFHSKPARKTLPARIESIHEDGTHAIVTMELPRPTIKALGIGATALVKIEDLEPRAEPKPEAPPKEDRPEPAKPAAEHETPALKDLRGMTKPMLKALKAAGLTTTAAVASSTVAELAALKGLGEKSATKLITEANRA